MFGIFEKKSKSENTKLIQDLGTLSGRIIEVAEGDEAERMIKGLAVILPIIVESKRHCGLDVKPDTRFARYLAAYEKQDVMKMARMTATMGEALKNIDNIQSRGELVYSWFVGEH